MRVLILGGTTEASALAELLAGDPRFDVVLSLAGRTSAPKTQPVTTRRGGFGGIDGLTRYLSEHKVEAMIDATHPYTDQMSAHAVAACARAVVPLGTLLRPAWTAQPGDTWQDAPSTSAAAGMLGAVPRRVFLSLGRQDVHRFSVAPQHHYIARVIERPKQASLPPNLVLLRQRGPFDLEAERRLLANEKIDVIVSKNSGGRATYPKIAAARELGLPVVMIARPDKPAGHALGSPEEALTWLAHERSLRGV